MRDFIGDLIGAATLFALIPILMVIGHGLGF